MIEELRELFAYNRWANERVLDAAAKLDESAFGRPLGSSFGSVRDTLAHVLAADWAWLERWRGRSPATPPAWDASTLAAIRSRWAELEREREAFVAGLTDADLERELAYRTLSGAAVRNTFSEMLRHVVNHSSYHRGQVVGMLRQLGAEGVNTDLIAYYRLRRAGELPAPSAPGDQVPAR